MEVLLGDANVGIDHERVMLACHCRRGIANLSGKLCDETVQLVAWLAVLL